MKNERNALKAGLFILISIGLILFIIVGIKGIKRFVDPQQHRVARFKLSDDIGGLSNGDPVRIGGATVGTVRDIDLDTESSDPGIVITFAIPRKYKIHTDAKLMVQTTVTGVSVLNFESLGGKAPELAENEVLAGESGMSFTTLATSANGLITAVRAKIDPIVERYNQMADKGTFALNAVGTLFDDSKSDFRGTIANLHAVTGDLKDRLPTMLDKVDRAMDQANAALVDLRKTLENARDATGAARSVIVSNRSKLDAMIASLKTAGDNLKFATAEIRRSPWRLLYQPGQSELENLNLYDSTRQFAEGAESMSDAAQALRDASKDPDTSKQQLEKLTEQLDKSFENFAQVESTLWSKVKP